MKHSAGSSFSKESFPFFLLVSILAVISFNRPVLGGEDKGRTVKLHIEHAEFSGNTITKATGTGEVIDEEERTIAKGNLSMIEGWMALKCPKGVTFKAYLKPDLDGELPEKWPGDPGTTLSSVTLGQDKKWRMDDESFAFLVDTRYGADVDFSSSFARATQINVMYKSELTLWGNKVSVGENGGTIRIVRGKIKSGTNIKVTSPDGKVTAYK